jgi:hypothetical protein
MRVQPHAETSSDTKEDAMSLTPEERAQLIVNLCCDQFPDWCDLTPGMPASIEIAIGREIRAAVAAQKERDKRRVLEQRCERGTTWDRALLTAVEAIEHHEPVVAAIRGSDDAG